MTEITKLDEGIKLMHNGIADQMVAEEVKAGGYDTEQDMPVEKRLAVELIASIFVDVVVKLAKAEGIRMAASAMKMHDNDFDMYRDPVDPEVELEAIEWLNEYADFIDPATNPEVLSEESDY